MKQLQEYIAFDLEFNTVGEHSHIIQVSAVKYSNHQEIALFDTYVHTKVPLQSFINGLTGITARDIIGAPKIETVLTDLQSFVGDTPLIGYNGHKSDLPLLVENGLDLTSQYQVDLYDEAFVRRSTDLNGIVNLKLTTVADFLGIKGKAHNSLEDARMTARVYEKFLDLDENKIYLKQQKEVAVDSPFATLGNLFD
ncbi:3'-5' exonuclease [Streptococcus agalactiae]|uniref:3'-5' exonuclease n=1 Tax=Streptococcus agalactiae TaxID=1311 RepID=UPI0002B9C1E1|nr:3'-5' exonuclease [Streptococcus agalactiae]AIX05408.1 exonuclease family protein [Streptococcus agalactiae CNCTC 10/84]EPT55212.1 DNA polymerase III subunit epsilon [Streptococcus agalactiae CCUG 25532]EPT85832.1 DNA polymerase III subunit epsilon [Streptococcus agalactiae BSU247]EPV20346.1 DNA polymerase III subunit epsilon [Streptococcus agalactiae GB00640]EPW98567.1 DNA polymerase III subunit epsilon [Streptococcus agalactiae MRI Z1-048]